jgi:signal peptide peptidase SppA
MGIFKNFFNKSQIGLIEMRGVIGNVGMKKNTITYDGYAELIKKAYKENKNKAIFILINSPGGSPSQSEMIHNLITKLKIKYNKSTYVFVEDIAASGGYYIACAGDKIYSTHNSIIGSIGVISAGFGFVELIEKIGVERRVYTQGKNKSILDPFLPEKKSDIDMLKAMQQDVLNNFKEVVISGRKDKLNYQHTPEEELFSGKVWSGVTAQKNGLVDNIDYPQNIAEQEFGDKVKFVKYQPKKSRLLSKLGLDTQAKSIITAIKEELIYNKFGL